MAELELPAEAAGPEPAPGEDVLVYLRHLAPREAQVVRLRHVEDLSLPEVAELLGISTSSAKTHYYRALEKLRSLLARDSPGSRDRQETEARD